MSKVFKSNIIANGYADLTASGANDAVPVHAVAVTTEALALNHVFEMFVLPPGYGVSELLAAVDDLDTGAAIILACGLMVGDPGDTVFANRTTSSLIGTEFFAGSNVGQAGGIARLSKIDGLVIAPSINRRSVGIQVTTAPGTPVAAGSRIVVSALLRPNFAGY